LLIYSLIFPPIANKWARQDKTKQPATLLKKSPTTIGFYTGFDCLFSDSTTRTLNKAFFSEQKKIQNSTLIF